MISDLRPYPAMKRSGVPWLGNVPEHWEVFPALAAYRPRQFKNNGLTEKTVLSLSYGRIIIKSPERLRGLVPESFETYQIVEPGNIIIRTTDLQNDQTSLRVGYARDHGIITSAYMCLETNKLILNEFGYQYINAYDLLKVIYGFGSGLRQNLNFSDIKRMPVLVPPHDEQAAIVRFLGYADRRISQYIRAKQKLIKLLEEQKQAIIHSAVTRGLDRNVCLKPSGVEWLGDVPEHWEVVRLGRLIELVTGFPFKSDGFTQETKDVSLLRGVNISPGKIRWNDVVRWPLSERDKYSAYDLQVGDIVLGMDRPIIQSGTRVATVSESDIPALLLQRVARIRPTDELQCAFLTLLLAGKSFANYLTPIFTGISVPHLSPEQIKAFRFALPPDNEQRAIVRWTEANTRKSHATILRAEREITFLHEYRTRLIADVVTGKLDVREVAATLPDDGEESEPVEAIGTLADDEADVTLDNVEADDELAEAI